MKAFVAGVLAVIVIAVAASFVLKGAETPTETANTSPTGARPN